MSFTIFGHILLLCFVASITLRHIHDGDLLWLELTRDTVMHLAHGCVHVGICHVQVYEKRFQALYIGRYLLIAESDRVDYTGHKHVLIPINNKQMDVNEDWCTLAPRTNHSFYHYML